MERLAERRSWNFPQLRLFLDDVEAIVGIVKSQCRRVGIQVGGYKMDGLEDLQELVKIGEKEVVALEVTCWTDKDTYVSISLDHWRAEIAVHDCADTQAMGIATRVVEVLNKRRKLFLRIVGGKWVIGVATLMAMFGAIGAVGLLSRGERVWALAGLVVIVLCVCAGYWNYVLLFRRYCVIRLCKAGEEMGFARRNKDDLVKIVVAALLGSLATVAVSSIQCEKGDGQKAGGNESGRVTPSSGEK
jgi:hypothetical protein